MRRELIRVERELAKFDEPGPDVPDAEQAWVELQTRLGQPTPKGYDGISRYVDTYFTKFRSTERERHNAQLGRLDRLAMRMKPHRARISTVKEDEKRRLKLLDMITADQVKHVAGPEKPMAVTVDQSAETAPMNNGESGPRQAAGLSDGDVITRSLGDILGTGWARLGLWLVALAAAVVDVGTFYQVLVTVLDAPERVVWVVVFGFAAVALTLAHWAGWQTRLFRNLRAEPRSRTAAVACWVVWLTLGVVAFVIRYRLAQANSSDTSTFDTNGSLPSTSTDGVDQTTEHYAALFFFVLYIATGAIAAVAGYFRPEPAAHQVRRAQRQRKRLIRQHARTMERLTRVEEALSAIDDTRKRREAAWADTAARCDAVSGFLKKKLVDHGEEAKGSAANDDEEASS